MTVYFIAAGFGVTNDMVKIGYTRGHAHSRMRDLQTGSPVLLDLIHEEPGYGIEYERALHEMFADDWSHGEWFHLTENTWNFIWMLKSGDHLSELINPNDYPNGLRCDACMNIAGVLEGVKETNFSWPPRPAWSLK